MKITKMVAGSLAVLAMLAAVGRAEERAKPNPLVPLKVDVVFSEYEGEKKVVSLPYTLAVNANEREYYVAGASPQTNLRMGVNVPVGTEKDGQVHYEYVGTHLDCQAASADEGRFRVFLGASRSSLYFPSTDSEKKSVGWEGILAQNGQPMIRRFDTQFNLLMRDGQTIENTLATDPVSGRIWRIVVTLHVVK
jgi:hypothetical protein